MNDFDVVTGPAPGLRPAALTDPAPQAPPEPRRAEPEAPKRERKGTEG